MRRITWTTFNPLRCGETALPSSLVLIARLVALVLILQGDSPFRRSLPFFEFLDALGLPAQFHLVLRVAADAGYLLVLFTPSVRIGSGLIGVAYLIGLLGCRPCHSVAHTYVACLFVVLSLSSRTSGSWLLRAQVVMLYAGATINKAVDADWWNGRYFETLMIERHQHEVYAWLASLFPPLWLSTIAGATTVITQAAMTVGLLVPRGYTLAITLGVALHGSMLLLLNTPFGPFFLAVLISYLAFIGWPERIDVSLGRTWRHHAWERALRLTNFDQRYRFTRSDRDVTHVTIGRTRYDGVTAFQQLLFFNPLTLFLAVLPLTSGGLRRAAFVALTIGFNPWLARLIHTKGGRRSTKATAAKPRGGPPFGKADPSL